jgi:hypothetical protein
MGIRYIRYNVTKVNQNLPTTSVKEEV